MRQTLILSLGLMFFSVTAVAGDTGGSKGGGAAPAHGAAPATPAAAVPAAGAPVAAPAIDWKGMDKKQRKAYMKKAVMPAAQKMFSEYDPKKYKKVTCATCHGDGINKGFKMPNPGLPKLPIEPAGFKALQEKKPEAMKFMAMTVKPTMASLLGLPESTQTNPEGFGCYACHSKDTAK